MTAPETSTVAWGGRELPYTIRRSARRKKTVAVTVDPAGSVLVVAPERLATTRLDAIVVRKAAWIAQRLRGLEAHGPAPVPREFVSGESVLYLGRHYRLKVHPDETGEARLRGGWLHVPCPRGSAANRPCARRPRLVVPAACGRATAQTGRGVAGKGRCRAAMRRRRRPAQALGKLRPARHDPPELAHHPGPDAPGRLRRRPRADAPAAPRSRPRLLAGRRTGHAGLRPPPR